METQTNYSVETAPETPKSYVGEAVKLAVTWAAINIFIFLLTWYGSPNLIANPAYGIISTLISVGLAVYFTLNLRKKVGGYWDFKGALRHIFVMFFVQVIISTLFTTVFAKFIEPSYADFMREQMLNSMTELYENMGLDSDQIDESLAQLETQLEKQLNPTMGEFIQSQSIIAIFYFIGALIFAAIFKRHRPIFAPINDEDENFEKN